MLCTRDVCGFMRQWQSVAVSGSRGGGARLGNEAQVVLADGGRPARLALVRMLEHLGACRPTAVVEHAPRQHAHHSGLARVNIAYHGHPQLQWKMAVSGAASDKDR